MRGGIFEVRATNRVDGAVRTGGVRAFGDWLRRTGGNVIGGVRGKGAPGQSTALHLRGRREAPTALRCSVSRPRRSTHCAHCAHCVRYVQTNATGQFTKRAARAATSPVLLGALQARRGLPEHAFAGNAVVRDAAEEPSRQVVSAGGDLWSDEDRRPGVGARSALRELTRLNCLSVTNEVSEASSATRPLAENRSAVGAKRRPRNHEPPAGTACRGAATLPASESPRAVQVTHDKRLQLPQRASRRALSRGSPR